MGDFYDTFCGGGGSGSGILRAYKRLGIRANGTFVNHWDKAIEIHEANHPEHRHFKEDLFLMDPVQHMPRRQYGLGWSSPSCFPEHVMVTTSKGQIPIKDIKVGDIVLTHKGRWRPVVALMNTVKDTIILKGQGHYGLETTEEHPFYSKRITNRPSLKDAKTGGRSGPRKRKMENPYWPEAKTMAGKLWALPRTVEPLPLPMDMNSIVDEGFFSFVGRWLGDGHLSKGDVSICAGYHELEDWNARLTRINLRYADGTPVSIRYTDKETARAYNFGNAQLCRWLQREFGSGAHRKNIPGWVYGLPENWKAALVDGYMSADGTEEKLRDACFTVSDRLANGIKLLVVSRGFAVSHHRGDRAAGEIQGRVTPACKGTRLGWTREIQKETSFRDSKHCFQFCKEVKTGRKDVTVYNFEVEEDNSYVVDGIVVHNCQQFSISRGNRPINEQGRSHADTVVSWMAHCMPECQIVENVKEFMHWCRLRQRRDKKSGELMWAREVPGKKKGTTKVKTFPRLEPAHRRRADEPEAVWEQRMIALGYDRHLEPDIRYRGEYFKAWIERIEALGYISDYRLLRSADYGDPTIRQRLFVMFVRKDTGKRIVWPDQRFIKPGAKRPVFKTRPDRPLAPWPTARNSVIDWSHKGTSIFHGRKPLAKATMRRIAIGTVQFGLREFFVPQSNFGGDRVRSSDAPVSTIRCNHRGEMLAQPFALTSNKGFGDGLRDLDKPAGTLTCNSRGEGLAEPFLVPSFGERPGQVPRTHGEAVVTASAFLLPKDQGHLGDYVTGVDQPCCTVQTTAVDHLIEPCIIQNNGCSTAISADEPLGTVTGMQTQYVMQPFISPLRSGSNGNHNTDEPVRALTASGQHQLLAEAFLLVLDNAGKNGKNQRAYSADEPVKTVPVKANQTLAEPSLSPLPSGVRFSLETLEDAVREVAPAGIDIGRVLALFEPLMEELKKAGRVDIRPWVYVYYSNGSVGCDIDTPVPTVRCKEATAICYPVLEFDGEFLLLDILYRMLSVKELQRAQGFPPDFVWPEGVTKTEIVKAIGNSVSCGVAEALTLAWLSQNEDISGFFEDAAAAA